MKILLPFIRTPNSFWRDRLEKFNLFLEKFNIFKPFSRQYSISMLPGNFRKHLIFRLFSGIEREHRRGMRYGLSKRFQENFLTKFLVVTEALIIFLTFRLFDLSYATKKGKRSIGHLVEPIFIDVLCYKKLN